MEKEITHQVVLTKEDGNYIIIHNAESLEYCEYMLKWYLAHQEFFNGTFSIREA